MEAHRIILSIAVLTVIIGVLSLSKPTITGFVPTATYSQGLDIDIQESQRFILSASEGTLKLSSLWLSGDVGGQGLVDIYLTDVTKKSLVYSNKRKKQTAFEQITGLATSELIIEPGQKLTTIDTLSDSYKTQSGTFTNVCIETCVIDETLYNKKNLYLDVIVEPGTSVHISELTFATMKE